MTDSELVNQLLDEIHQISANMATKADIARIDKNIEDLNKVVWKGNGQPPLTRLVDKLQGEVQGLWRAYRGLKDQTQPAGKGAITADSIWKFSSPILVAIIVYFLLTWIPAVQKHIDQDQVVHTAQATQVCTPTPIPTRTP